MPSGPVTRRRKREQIRADENKNQCYEMFGFHVRCECRLTTQAQRPGAREATIATTTLPPGSLQRMVRRLNVAVMSLPHK